MRIVEEVGETTKKTHLVWCVLALARRVFGKLPPQPVECVKMGLQLRVRGGGARGGLEMTGGMDGRLVVVRWWRRRDDEEKKRKRPRSHGSVSGAPVSVCVCVYVPLRCCVSGASVCEGERTRDSLFIFFFTSLFFLSPPPQSPHPYDTRRRRRQRHGTPALSSFTRHSVQKGRPRRGVNRGGEKYSLDDTYFFYIFVPPRRPL